MESPILPLGLKDWQLDEPDLYKRYVYSCFAITGVQVPTDVDLSVTADAVAHCVALGQGVVSYKDWRAARFDVMTKLAHDISHVPGYENL